MDKYEKLEEIGQGSFGQVYRGRVRKTGEIVALKVIKFSDASEGIPTSVLEEVSLFKEMEHANIVRLLDVVFEDCAIYLLFEYLDLDLHTVINNAEIPLTLNTVKKFLYQILLAVTYLHSHKVLLRDLKPQNILINRSQGMVKLADFNLARANGVPLKAYASEIGTLYYFAPELLLGSVEYSIPTDIWAVGCIFAEMVLRRVIFPGHSEINQLTLICELLGTPPQEISLGFTSKFKYSDILSDQTPKDLALEFSSLEPAGVDLLSKMLCLDPRKRISAQDALGHEYFHNL